MVKKAVTPRASHDRLIVQEMQDETLIYDCARDKAHCLNPSAALVWRHCDGRTSVGEVATILHQRLGVPADEQIVWLAMKQLRKAHLIEAEATPSPPELRQIARRSVIKRLGLMGGGALLLPVVTSIIAPTAASAASCLPPGSACTSSAQCCSGVCSGTCL